jgi:hypothetical protein
MTQPNVLQVYELWESLRADCEAGGLEGKEFNNRQKRITDLYKRLNNQEQGAFHHEVWLAQPKADLNAHYGKLNTDAIRKMLFQQVSKNQ